MVDKYDIKALAICFLHSYIDNSHEKQAKELVLAKFPHLSVSISSEVLPFMREYERWSTTTINAYVQPLTDLYLGNLEKGLEDLGFSGRLLIMTSSGGMVTADIARFQFDGSIDKRRHVCCGRLGELTLSFDMGGTTAKALIRDGKPLRRYEFWHANMILNKSGLPPHPSNRYDRDRCWWGSIAQVNDSGLLAVGPQARELIRGRRVMTRRTLPTLTDANLTLGYLVAFFFRGENGSY